MLPHFWKRLLLWSRTHGEAVIVLGQWAEFGLSLTWLQLLPKARNHTGQCILAWAVSSPLGFSWQGKPSLCRRKTGNGSLAERAHPAHVHPWALAAHTKTFCFFWILLMDFSGFSVIVWALEINHVPSWKPLLFFFYYFSACCIKYHPLAPRALREAASTTRSPQRSRITCLGTHVAGWLQHVHWSQLLMAPQGTEQRHQLSTG